MTMSVYPFLLRGVTLAGIDSAWYAAPRRTAIWKKLATTWKPDFLDEVATETDLAGVAELVPRILAGQVTGRVIVRMNEFAR